MERNRYKVRGFVFMMGLTLLSPAAEGGQESSSVGSTSVNQVLEWNQIFVETLIATNTANSSSQRLGAIVHTAIFDACNGIEQRYSPIFVRDRAPGGASRRAAIVAAGVHVVSGPLPVPKSRAGRPLCGFSGGAARCDCQDNRRITLPASVHNGNRTWRRVGFRCSVHCARLARDRWFQRELPSVHRRDGDRASGGPRRRRSVP